MNEKVVTIIEQLAAQFGVATEMLWASLLRQALLASTIDLIWVALVAAMVYAYIRFTIYAYNMVNVGKPREGGTYHYKWEDIAWLPIGMGWVVVILFVLAMLSGLSTTLAGFFNPEYWAIQKILSLIKCK